MTRKITHPKIKLGFNVFEKPVEEYVDYAIEHGINHLEIDLIKEHSYLTSFSTERIKTLKHLTEIHGIGLSLHTPYSINPGDRRLSSREGTITYLTQCVILASKLNATHLTTHIGFFYGMPIWRWIRQQALKRLLDSMEQVLHYCQTYKIKIALENSIPKSLDSQFYFLGDNMGDFDFIFSNLDSPYLNLCLDVGHAHIGEGVLKYIKRFGSKIINVHYHDNRGKKDEHMLVGEGTIPWKEAVESLQNIGFAGPYISECFKTEPHEAADRLLRYF